MKKVSTEIKWAVIFTLVSLLWMLGEKLTGLHSEHIDKHPIYTNFFAFIAIGAYVFALLDKRKRDFKDGMSYMQGFISGCILTAFAVLLTPLAQYLTHYVISPEYFTNAIAYAVENGYSSQEEAESHFNFSSYLMMSTGFALVAGVITSAIVSVFVKSRKQA